MKYIEDKNIRAVLFDLDGTIYYGSKLIPGADEVVRRCRELGKQVYFMTNNSTKTRKQIWEKLTGMGLACSYEEVYTGSYAAALYAHQMGYKTVYIMGSDALAEEFAGLGVTVSDHAEVVIVGYDMDFNYQKLTDALQVALRADKIIAQHRGYGQIWILLAAAIIYFLINVVIELVFNSLTRHYSRHERGIA